jgi:hypothetical protein
MGPMIGVSVSRSRVRGDVYLRAKKNMFLVEHGDEFCNFI